MPCDTQVLPGQTLEQRNREIDEALRRLESQLQAGQVVVKIGANGAIAFDSWANRDRVTDVCAYRALTLKNSFALRRAIATAEARSGRKVNPRAVAAGVHSHDGGKSWHPGH